MNEDRERRPHPLPSQLNRQPFRSRRSFCRFRLPRTTDSCCRASECCRAISAEELVHQTGRRGCFSRIAPEVFYGSGTCFRRKCSQAKPSWLSCTANHMFERCVCGAVPAISCQPSVSELLKCVPDAQLQTTMLLTPGTAHNPTQLNS